ncbi:MAG: glycosyltransferase, partial [Candidatus Bathyarchaeia archaeon]
YGTGMYIERALQRHCNTITVRMGGYEPYNLLRRLSPRPLVKLMDKIIKLKFRTRFPQPDLVLVVDPVRCNFDFGNFDAPTAYYAIDSHVAFSKHIEEAKVSDYDFVFVAQRDWTPKYKEHGCERVYWLPLACDPDIHRRWNQPLRYDLCFLGGILAGSKREQTISKLKRNFNVFVGKAYLHEMAKIYSQSRIIFNESLLGDLNMRVFEAMSCGRLLLTDRVGNGLEELFRDKKHLVIYDDYSDLIQKIRHYLNNPKQSERIALNGLREVHKHHTYSHRVRYLIETILGKD